MTILEGDRKNIRLGHVIEEKKVKRNRLKKVMKLK